MLNQAIVVGRISNYDEIGRVVTIAVSRSFKNINGEYETDYIPIKLWNNATPQMELVKIGDIIGIKGRIERTGIELRIVAEKITFLAQGKQEEVTNEN
jgi:single-strand DNA-binding protein